MIVSVSGKNDNGVVEDVDMGKWGMLKGVVGVLVVVFFVVIVKKVLVVEE